MTTYLTLTEAREMISSRPCKIVCGHARGRRIELKALTDEPNAAGVVTGTLFLGHLREVTFVQLNADGFLEGPGYDSGNRDGSNASTSYDCRFASEKSVEKQEAM